MLTSKMLLGVALLVLVVACVEAEKCAPDECEKKTCVEPEDCKGGKVAGYCGCCKECAKLEGEDCGGDPGLYAGKCDDGLTCTSGWPFGKCVKSKK